MYILFNGQGITLKITLFVFSLCSRSQGVVNCFSKDGYILIWPWKSKIWSRTLGLRFKRRSFREWLLKLNINTLSIKCRLKISLIYRVPSLKRAYNLEGMRALLDAHFKLCVLFLRLFIRGSYNITCVLINK